MSNIIVLKCTVLVQFHLKTYTTPVLLYIVFQINKNHLTTEPLTGISYYLSLRLCLTIWSFLSSAVIKIS